MSALLLHAQENKLLFQNLATDTILEKKAEVTANIAFAKCNSNPDSALLLARKSINMAITAKSSKEYAVAFGITGWAHFKIGNKDSAVWYTTSAKTMFHELHLTSLESRMLMNLSTIYESKSDYTKALENLTASMLLANATKDSLTMIIAEKMIGIIYRRQGYYDKAKLYLEKAVKAASIQRNPKYYGDAVSSLASLYVQMDSFNTAKMLYREALIAYKSVDDLSGAAIINEDMALCFSKAETHQLLDSALFYYQQAYNLNIQLNNNHDAAYEKMAMSEVLIKEKQYKLAEKNLKESLQVFDSLDNVNEEYLGYETLSTLYDSIHDYKKAYACILKANIYYDSLNKQEKNRVIADMLAKYEANKKDTTIALLNTRSELAERQLSKTRITEVFSLILIVLSVMLTLVLLNRNNIKQRLGQLQMRNQIASDLHDEVGSSLSSILMLGKMALAEESGRSDIISKINNNAAEMIERISDIVWATNPKYDDGKNLHEKINNYLMQVNHLPKQTLHLDIGHEIETMKFRMDIRRNVFLIVKEAINNILKHAAATIINITIHSEHRKLYIQITDNGRGFDTENSNDGNGLENMQARAESIGGIFSLTSEQNKGTTISIVIPL